MTHHLTIEVGQDGLTGDIQISINKISDNDNGTGYRLAGPTFNGTGRVLATHTLTAGDAAEIREYLNAVFPVSAAARC